MEMAERLSEKENCRLGDNIVYLTRQGIIANSPAYPVLNPLGGEPAAQGTIREEPNKTLHVTGFRVEFFRIQGVPTRRPKVR
jgi:hypothetical protein